MAHAGITRQLLALALALACGPVAPVWAGSSNSLLDVSPDGTRLVVANTDSGTVTVADLKTRKKLCEVPVGDAPEGASWVGAGPLALATVYGDDAVRFVDTAAGAVVFTLKVADEPYGVVVTKDGNRAYVSHDYPGSVTEIDVPGRKVLRTIPVGKGCRGLALTPDEKTLVVTEFHTARLLAVDVATGKVVDRWDGYESDNLCRQVVVHPTFPAAYAPHIRSRTTAHAARGSIFGQLSAFDLTPPAAGERRRRSHAVDSFNRVYVVCNPWEMAVSPDGNRAYAIYAGSNDLNVFRPLGDSYQDLDALGRAAEVGRHPRAIRVSPDGQEVYVYNTLDHEVGVYTADVRKKLAGIPVCDPPHTAAWRRGKELFHSAEYPMGSARWISCASCHPDGLHDGRVWVDPEGRRKTPNLFGTAHTHPLHWSADRDEVQDFEYTIRGKLMRGAGLAKGPLKAGEPFAPVALDEPLAGRSKDLDALAVYTNSFGFRLSPHIPAPGKLSAEAERGKAVFASKEARCAECHSGPYYTDSRLARPLILHDVGTGDAKDEKMGPRYDTPTLLGVYRVDSYLHDGRAKTLHDVLTTHNTGDRHGKTSHLSKRETDDLVAFLKSLPYEPPPDETPNTVKERLRR